MVQAVQNRQADNLALRQLIRPLSWLPQVIQAVKALMLRADIRDVSRSTQAN